jgi:hypothetical protein
MRTSSGLGIGTGREVASVYLSGSMRKTSSASTGSSTACACAAIDRPVIAIKSEVSWSIVSEIRSSRARFFAF